MREFINIILEGLETTNHNPELDGTDAVAHIDPEMELTERTHNVYTGMGSKVVAVEDPNSQQLTTWLDRFHDLRGMIDDEGHLFIWDAMQLTHFNAEMQLGVKCDIGLYLRERLDGRIAVRWEDYSGEGNTPEANPAFVRMLRSFQSVIGKTTAVYEATTE